MYKETIPNSIARCIAGDEYVEGYTYTLISDPDKFVLSASDSNGEVKMEIELQSDYIREEEEDDDIFKAQYKEHDYKTDVVRSWIMVGVCVGLLVLGIGVTLLFLKIGGAI